MLKFRKEPGGHKIADLGGLKVSDPGGSKILGSDPNPGGGYIKDSGKGI